MPLPNPSLAFTPFDILTAAELNQMHANSVALAAGTGLNDGVITTPKIADGAITAVKTTGIWWEEIGRTTLASSASTISASFPARKYLYILFYIRATGGTISCAVRFNGDTASNYAFANADNGGSASGAGNQSSLSLSQALNMQQNGYLHVDNLANFEKIIDATATVITTAGASSSPGRRDLFGKWTNTSVQISSVTVANLFGGTGSYAAGSELIILGHN